MLASLDRNFRENGALYSLLKDKAFVRSRQVLNGKAIELRESGRGKRKKKADPVIAEEEEQLWETGALGCDNPETLNHSLWYTTRQGGLVKQNRRVMQWVFVSGYDRCCVKLLELQVCKRPAKFRICGPLYLRPL